MSRCGLHECGRDTRKPLNDNSANSGKCKTGEKKKMIADGPACARNRVGCGHGPKLTQQNHQ